MEPSRADAAGKEEEEERPPPPPKYVQGGGGTRAAGAAAWGGTQPREHGLPKEERGKESPKKYSKEGAILCFKKKSMSSIKFLLFLLWILA